MPLLFKERKTFLSNGYLQRKLRRVAKGRLTICRNEGLIRVSFRLDHKGHPRRKDDAPARQGMRGNGSHENDLSFGMSDGAASSQVVCGRSGRGCENDAIASILSHSLLFLKNRKSAQSPVCPALHHQVIQRTFGKTAFVTIAKHASSTDSV